MKQKQVLLLLIVVVSAYAARDFLKVWYLMTTYNWTKFDHWFKTYGIKYGVPPEWLKAISLNESSLGKHPSVARGLIVPSDVEGSKSEDGLSWGIMQITLATAKSFDPAATPQKLNDPEYSIKLAAQIVADNMRQFDRNDSRYIEWVFKAYNQGPGHTKNERAGKPSNPSWQKHVQEYWARAQRNLTQVGGIA